MTRDGDFQPILTAADPVWRCVHVAVALKIRNLALRFPVKRERWTPQRTIVVRLPGHSALERGLKHVDCRSDERTDDESANRLCPHNFRTAGCVGADSGRRSDDAGSG